MIYWFTGQPGSGKTTLAKVLITHLEKSGKTVTHIDGDGLRELTQNFDYSEEGRRVNIQRAQEIATEKQKESEVVVSVVAPYRDLREDLKAKTTLLEFYTHTTEIRGKEHFKVADYQQPIDNFIAINTNESIETCFELIQQEIQKKNQHSMFVGRYQPLHDGHKWLFEQRLQEGKNILICVRDMIIDDKNPYAAEQVKQNIIKHYSDEVLVGKVKVIIIPDIESINYGRGVGYEIKQHKPPQKIKEISATDIRNKLNK